MESTDLQSIQKKKVMTFASWKGGVIWYIFTGIIFLVLMQLSPIYNPFVLPGEVGILNRPEWAIIYILIWPIVFIIFFIQFLPPAIGIEGPDPIQIMGFDWFELSILSTCLIAPIISFIISEMVHRLLLSMRYKYNQSLRA